jgi:hypothetical protein
MYCVQFTAYTGQSEVIAHYSIHASPYVVTLYLTGKLIYSHRKEISLDFVLYYYISLLNEPSVIFMFDKLSKYFITIVSTVLYKMLKCLYYVNVCLNLNKCLSIFVPGFTFCNDRERESDRSIMFRYFYMGYLFLEFLFVTTENLNLFFPMIQKRKKRERT